MSVTSSSAPGSGSQLDRIEAKLDRLQVALDRADPVLDQLPDLLSTLANVVDDAAARDGGARFDDRVRRGLALLLRLCDPALLAALERLLDPRAVDLLAAAAAELPPASTAPAEDHGVLALLAVLREDEVQRATSFLVHFARRLGRVLGERDRRELER